MLCSPTVRDAVHKWLATFPINAELLALPGRRSRVSAYLQRWRKRSQAVDIMENASDYTVCFPNMMDESLFQRFVTRVAAYIESVSSAPLTPKAVEAALGITARERIRWYKDGRLPIIDKRISHKGKSAVSFPLFPAEEIIHPAARPDVIELWRAADLSA